MIAILLASFPGIPELLWSGLTSLSVDDTDGSADLVETTELGASVWTSTDLVSGLPLTGSPSTTSMTLHSSPNREGTASLFNLFLGLPPTASIDLMGTFKISQNITHTMNKYLSKHKDVRGA